MKFVNIGNDAIQLNFMQAHQEGKACPPKSNIYAFERYAHDLVKLAEVDAILISCSTMNRSYSIVQEAVRGFNVPVVSIDMPMMEKAVCHGGGILVIATHGPTVKSTQLLLEETAKKMKRNVSYTGITVEEAFGFLDKGLILEHNDCIARTIRKEKKKKDFQVVVLAQLSMSVFKLSYPDTEKEFGVKVLTSAEAGFERIKEIFLKD